MNILMFGQSEANCFPFTSHYAMQTIFNYSELAKLMCRSWLYFKYVTAGTIQLHVDVVEAKLAADTHLLYSHEEDIYFAILKNSLQNCELFF